MPLPWVCEHHHANYKLIPSVEALGFLLVGSNPLRQLLLVYNRSSNSHANGPYSTSVLC
jgi:hypothetical protein